jgi:RNA polymerase sigma-70 factor (ECF subfamily)
MVSGNGLQRPDVATTLRVENGTRHVVDGPFADSKEMLGGYVILDVPDLDAALEWAARAPCVTAGLGRDPPCAAAAERLMDRARHDAADQAEVVARSSYGKLLAILAKRCGDIAVAEDALGDAFAAALAQWPRDGTPTNPLGWLLTVARRSIGHAAGRRQTAEAAIELVQLLQDEREATVASAFGDERLALMFVCAHPAIDSDVQTPLMLQTVLGLDAARIAACFLVSSGTMSQRLVRAKRKIRDAGIAFVVPDRTDLTGRLDMVLSAVYAAYGTAWEDVSGTDSKLGGLASEAIWLARLLRQVAAR